ncbi:CsbD-like [Mesorhizobium sp. NFR06]|jgi:uncharacterized protein YjbJ (UPF0337 family)|nr:CsbD-like [Mesorhizobium sp. NFR06]
MGSTADKVKGTVNEAAGSARQAAGRAVGNHEEQAKGVVQKTKGEAQGSGSRISEGATRIPAWLTFCASSSSASAPPAISRTMWRSCQ